MIAKQCVNTIIFLLFLGPIFLDANVPLSHADMLFSTDIPITLGSHPFEERTSFPMNPLVSFLIFPVQAWGSPKE